MVKHHIQKYLHVPGMSCIYQILKQHIFRLISGIYFFEIKSMVTMVVVTTGIFHHRGNPNRGKTQGLNVVQLLNKPFKITSPCRVALVHRFSIPTMHIVFRVAVVKAGGHYKVYGFISKIGPCRREKSTIGKDTTATNKEERQHQQIKSAVAPVMCKSFHGI